MTPDVHKACSKRAFEGLVKKWRRQLHAWDPPSDDSESTELPKHAAADSRSHADSAAPKAAEPFDQENDLKVRRGVFGLIRVWVHF